VHFFDAATPFEETLSTLDGLVRSGKVRFGDFIGYVIPVAA
jgi:aryl-alcohol dehydrogenase-like predicted oxidoreductase